MIKTVKGIAMVVVMIALIGVVGHIEHNYTRDYCTVVEATDTGFIAEDRTGNTWYYEAEGYSVGDTVELRMHDNFTSAYIDDDIIKRVVRVED